MFTYGANDDDDKKKMSERETSTNDSGARAWAEGKTALGIT